MTPEEVAECRAARDRFLAGNSSQVLLADILSALLEHIDSQADEIKRLEDALVEERAWRNFFAANARTEALADFGYSLVKDRHFTRAREQLRAEGAIR